MTPQNADGPRVSGGSARETLVVLALELDSLAAACELATRQKDDFRGEVVVLCSAQTSDVVRPQQMVTVIPVPEGVSAAEARRIGVNRAAGDVVRVTTVGGRTRWQSAAWADRLSRAGVLRLGQRASRP